ncbi:putative nuclear GTPase SLIP-GC-like isoform X1 [Apostichopus japonicus]|uniref:Putative nuclear GTPase SLIP-GC-like isoform X1 n=1 Tax=Stichopus japonicus TaxID=307972 RepID=A0A2G8L2E7_STIJA|nr:putative nuclear GTPase SLIP-GC-like isoform X1 [Apostichopus japonicus]
MDHYVKNILTEWNLEMLHEVFEENEIDKEALFLLGEEDVRAWIPKTGPRLKFLKRLADLKVTSSSYCSFDSVTRAGLMGYTCYVCKRDLPLSSLRWHLKVLHGINSDSSTYMCYQDGCMRTFTRYCSYRKHLVNVHSDKMSEEEPHRPTDGPCENHGIVPANVNQQQDNDSESTSDYEPVCEVSPEILDFDEHGVCTEAALFVSKLRSCSSMTMSSTSFVIESVSSMVKNIVGNLKASTIESFKRYADSPRNRLSYLRNLKKTLIH